MSGNQKLRAVVVFVGVIALLSATCYAGLGSSLMVGMSFLVLEIVTLYLRLLLRMGF